MTTFAVLPIKRFDAAKQRLAPALGQGSRRALAEAMAADVLVALRRTEGIDQVVVVTGEGSAQALAGAHGAAVVDDPRDPGQSAAATLGIRHALSAGADRVLLVPGDCPAIDPQELATLLASPDPVTIVPDRHGSGTNALLLAPPEVIAPSFGPGSRERHERAAQDAGVSYSIAELPSLLLDVDTADDLETLRERLASVHGGAGNTRGRLAAWAR